MHILIYNEKAFGRSLSIYGLFHMYKRYKTLVFPSLLEDPLLHTKDKTKIQELLKKPWNPYIRRHSALTEKSKILKEHTLRQHAGWSQTSNMHRKYIHYYGNESNESILEAYGLINKNKQEIDKLKPKSCPNCQELNKIDSKFCVKCRMVLSYDAYIEATQYNEEFEETRLEKLEAKLDALTRQFLENNVAVGTSSGSDTNELHRRPMTDEEIEHELSMRRQRVRIRRMKEKKLWQELND
jgi:hypothetical protein